MAFEMLQGQTVYKEVVSTSNPFWLNGIYHEGEKIITYEALPDSFIEPMDKEESDYLPTGITLRDSRWLLTGANLNTYRENNDDSSLADVIYLDNPETGRKKTPYVVFDKEDWETDSGMELLDSDGYNYVLVKSGKV